MNYALDALWWRLTNPVVRDLASLLTAQPLWQTGCELPVRELLGADGFRLLLAWDNNTQSLPQRHQFNRLGHYAEALLRYWFTHAPHSELLAQEFKIYHNNQTIGALDFVVRLNGCVYHIELCCKYYGGADGVITHMRGLNKNDNLSYKINKINQQLSLSHDLNLWGEIRRASIVRGMGFTHSGEFAQAWAGILLSDAHTLDEQARFYWLDHMAYLSPARVVLEETVGRDEVVQIGLYAQVVLRPDGFWHEINRIMIQ